MGETVILTKDSETNQGANNPALEWKVLYATNCHFRSVLNYKKYSLIHKSQSYNNNNARAGKSIERMKTWVKMNKFDDRNSITVLPLLALFKRARN